MKHKRVIAVIATVALLSIASVGSVFAETQYTTRDQINSKGKIPTSSPDVIFDSDDFVTLADKIDDVDSNLTLKRAEQVSGNSISTIPKCRMVSATISCGYSNEVLKSKIVFYYEEIPTDGTIYSYNCGYSGSDNLHQRLAVRRNSDESLSIWITTSNYNGTEYKTNIGTALDIYYE